MWVVREQWKGSEIGSPEESNWQVGEKDKLAEVCGRWGVNNEENEKKKWVIDLSVLSSRDSIQTAFFEF